MDSLLTGKLTGNLAELDPSEGLWMPIYRGFAGTCRPVPYATEQGIFCTEQGILFDRTGNESESRELPCQGFAFTKAAGAPVDQGGSTKAVPDDDNQ